MRLYYILALLLLGSATFLGMLANDARESAARVESRNASLRVELASLGSEIDAMERLAPSPLRFSGDALAEFFTRTVEAGEVLGAGVRIEPRDTGGRTLAFVNFKQGLKRCGLTLRAGLEASGAAPILAMFEEELADLPVTVRKVTARVVNDVVTVSMDVDVFGRSP